MNEPEPLEIVQSVTDILNSLAVPYVICGSMASIAHATIRSTMDVDLIAELNDDHVTVLADKLQDQFYLDRDSMRQAIKLRCSFSLIHLETMFKVDVFIAKDRAFDRQQLKRRVAQKVLAGSDKTIWVLSAEDIILAKLEWFRLGGEVSERQWRDILGVLITQKDTLDYAYLKYWADELGVADLLRQVLDER